MADSQLQPIRHAFARNAHRSFALVLIVAVAGFAIVSERLLQNRAKRCALTRARLCAAALTPGPNGDLTGCTDRLRSRYDGLLAVATVDASGRLGSLHPDRSEYRRAAAATLENRPEYGGSRPTLLRTTVMLTGRRKTVWGVVLALNGDSSPAATRVLMLFAREPYLGALARATTAFAILIASAACVGSCVVTRWFNRRVAQPLDSLARPPPDRAASSKSPIGLDTGGLREMERIAGRFRTLLRNLGDSDARVRHVEREAQWNLQRREAGFDRLLRRAKDQASIDALTGLRNRAALSEEFEPMVAGQRAKDRDLAVVMLDIDDFKHHNDTFGHKAGDEVLRFTGELLRAGLRPGDHAIRYGGDEFLLLLPDVNVSQAHRITKRLVRLFKQYARAINADRSLSLSAGVAALSDHATSDAQALLARADAALYAAKRKGKNAVMTG